MSFSFEISEELIFVHATGIVTPEQFKSLFESVASDPRFHSNLDIFYLLADGLAFESDGIEQYDDIVQAVREVRAESMYRQACAGGSVEARSVFLAAFEACNQHAEGRAFEALGEALEWLGVDTARAMQHLSAEDVAGPHADAASDADR